jgi:hypothetical protein
MARVATKCMFCGRRLMLLKSKVRRRNFCGRLHYRAYLKRCPPPGYNRAEKLWRLHDRSRISDLAYKITLHYGSLQKAEDATGISATTLHKHAAGGDRQPWRMYDNNLVRFARECGLPPSALADRVIRRRGEGGQK